MAEPRPLERLTGQDLLMLLADDFGWSEDIGVLAILDGTRLLGPDGRLRVDEVGRRLEPRLHLVPRFRQLHYRPRWGLGWPLWSTPPPSTSPTTFGSTRYRRPPTRPSCWRRAPGCAGGG